MGGSPFAPDGASGDTPTPNRLRVPAHKDGLPPEAEGVGWRRGWDWLAPLPAPAALADECPLGPCRRTLAPSTSPAQPEPQGDRFGSPCGSGGGGGIRTHGTPKGTTVFETVPFDRSGTPPQADRWVCVPDLPRRQSLAHAQAAFKPMPTCQSIQQAGVRPAGEPRPRARRRGPRAPRPPRRCQGGRQSPI